MDNTHDRHHQPARNDRRRNRRGLFRRDGGAPVRRRNARVGDRSFAPYSAEAGDHPDTSRHAHDPYGEGNTGRDGETHSDSHSPRELQPSSGSMELHRVRPLKNTTVVFEVEPIQRQASRHRRAERYFRISEIRGAKDIGLMVATVSGVHPEILQRPDNAPPHERCS